MTSTFVDTNVLVYARDISEPVKHARAVEWLDHLWTSGTGAISTQVLNEYYVTVTRKLSTPLSVGQARADMNDLMVWGPVPTTPTLLRIATGVEDRFGLSWWDSLIVAAAQLADADSLLTEDLQDGQDLGGLVVVNPFEHTPNSPVR